MAAADSAFASATKLAPHFSIVSLVPAAVLTVSLSLLLGSHPWSGRPEWSDAFANLTNPTFAQLASGILAVGVVALAMHPLQFPLIQLLEGYWGRSSAALKVATRRIGHHQSLLAELEAAMTGVPADGAPTESALPPHEVDPAWWRSEASRLRDRYPMEPADVRPTRLGNVLRRYEQAAGNPYGLNLVTTAPMLQLVADEGHVAYVRDQRTQLDLATAMSAVCAMLAVSSALLLLPTGWWLLLAGVPYALAYAFYRGACSVAEEYGTALYALIDLNRTALYQRLRVEPGRSLNAERDANENLMEVLGDRTRLAELELTEPLPIAHLTPKDPATTPAD